jgi:hypothetical protein
MKNIFAIVAAAGGVVVGIAGARVFAPVPAAPVTVCAATEAAADAKADAIARQLHAHDHDAYVPKPTAPIGELPKPADPSNTAGH